VHQLTPEDFVTKKAKKATRRPARQRAASSRPLKSAKKSRKTTPRRRTPSTQKEPSTLQTLAVSVRGSVAGAIAKVSGGVRGAKAPPDAIELLEAEHRRFEELLKQGEETTERARKQRRRLLRTLTDALNAHERMEERVLYPALRSHPEAREVVLEGYEEHHVADLIVEELHAVATDDEAWGAKFKVLKENIEHHIKEEEGEMFRTARGLFPRDTLRAMARQMVALRNRS
jgi:hemerythrin-like domain-containing protein